MINQNLKLTPARRFTNCCTGLLKHKLKSLRAALEQFNFRLCRAVEECQETTSLPLKKGQIKIWKLVYSLCCRSPHATCVKQMAGNQLVINKSQKHQ